MLDTERKITEAGLKVISSGLLPEGTLLMSSRAPVGYLAISKIPVAINQGYIAMNFNKILSNYYMLNWCKLNMNTIVGIANGTTFLEVSKSNFKTLDILIPSKETVLAYDYLVGSLYENIAANENQNKLLAKTRDTLLPKLLSGELDVSQLSNLEPMTTP